MNTKTIIPIDSNKSIKIGNVVAKGKCVIGVKITQSNIIVTTNTNGPDITIVDDNDKSNATIIYIDDIYVKGENAIGIDL